MSRRMQVLVLAWLAMAPSNNIQPDTSVQNILAVYEVGLRG